MNIDPQQLLSKTINETNLPNSVLNRKQADRFIDLVIDHSILLKNVRTRKVDHAKGEINKLNLGSIVTEGANVGLTSVSTRTPSESKVDYDTVKYRSAFDLVTDFVEDNIEGAGVRDTLLGMFSKRIAIDLELAAIEGDSSLTTGDAQSDSNNLLGANDGFLKILDDNVPAGQKLDANGTASSKKLFHDAKRKVPIRFRVAMPDYRWLVSPSVHDKWELDTSDRATNAGDSALVGQFISRPYGIPLFEVPLMPDDLTIGTTATDGTKIPLTPLNNLIWFIQRDITIEWDRQPRSDSWEVTIHTRADAQVEDSNMVVLTNNISEGGTDYA